MPEVTVNMPSFNEVVRNNGVLQFEQNDRDKGPPDAVLLSL